VEPGRATSLTMFPEIKKIKKFKRGKQGLWVWLQVVELGLVPSKHKRLSSNPSTGEREREGERKRERERKSQNLSPILLG
jgi:hypothetical protein